MKNRLQIKSALVVLLSVIGILKLNAQCSYIPATTSATDTISYTFSGGSFQSYGCAPIDPTYWLSGNGITVTINYVNPQDFPKFRVWGMNNDDSAMVTVNGNYYPLNAATASYSAKVVCGISPGPDGIIFANGKIVGANNNQIGNYSYSDVQLNTTNVNTIVVTGISGAGWGFAGSTVYCPYVSGVTEEENSKVSVYPNPASDLLMIEAENNNINTLLIYDVLGNICLEKAFTKKALINVSAFKQGIYFYELRGNKETFKYGKFLRQ